jgi:predicted transcriptional regulator
MDMMADKEHKIGVKVIMGLGKKRSNIGKWLDRRGITQEWLMKQSKLGRSTVSDLCSGKRTPTLPTVKKIMVALKKIDPNVKAEDFFDL